MKATILLLLLLSVVAPLYADELDRSFVSPPDSAKPGVLWMWMGCNLSRDGITRDLEALKAAGFNRTTMFSLADVTTPWAGEIRNSPTPEILSWTEPWWKLGWHARRPHDILQLPQPHERRWGRDRKVRSYCRRQKPGPKPNKRQRN
jgi:hypothetical protein